MASETHALLSEAVGLVTKIESTEQTGDYEIPFEQLNVSSFGHLIVKLLRWSTAHNVSVRDAFVTKFKWALSRTRTSAVTPELRKEMCRVYSECIVARRNEADIRGLLNFAWPGESDGQLKIFFGLLREAVGNDAAWLQSIVYSTMTNPLASCPWKADFCGTFIHILPIDLIDILVDHWND
jgi:hypothetical protein